MTLRVEVSIVPFGDENKKRIIETLNISNIGEGKGILKDSDWYEYVIEHNEYKSKKENLPRVFHRRSKGALELVRTAIEKIQK